MKTISDGTDSNNPLEDLYVSKDEVDFEQPCNGLNGVIQIIKETGEPWPQSDFEDLLNKQQFVALMHYRRAAVELDHLERGSWRSTGWFNEYIDVDSSRFSHYSSDLTFVENDADRGGYYIPGFDINEAIDEIEDESSKVTNQRLEKDCHKTMLLPESYLSRPNPVS